MSQVPLYPAIVAGAIILTLFFDSTAAVEALPRPLAAAVIIPLVLQVLLSVVVRNRHLGAYITVAVVLGLMGWRHVALILIGVPISIVVPGFLMRRVVRHIEWRRATELLNVVAIVMLLLVVGTTWNSGSLVSNASVASESAGGSGPDVYLILLDGYPRADTLADDFGLDNSAFLSEMEALGFDSADRARSNYPLTALTLASMFNMRHVDSLEGLESPPARVQDQYRLLARAINKSDGIDAFRERGYEIVTVPSPFSNLALYAADRRLDDGRLTEFELAILQQGMLPDVVPSLQRSWQTDDLRARVTTTLDRTVELAKERGGRPKFVLSHLMSPHAPVLFGPDGSSRHGWPCFPRCSAFDPGHAYPDALVAEAIAGQVTHLNDLVVDAVRKIITTSERPPIVIVFSDHGLRHNPDDRAEMLRSLLLAYTPGHPGLVPDDATPINLLARILNAYQGAAIPLASEESYWVDFLHLRIEDLTKIEAGTPLIDPEVVSGVRRGRVVAGGMRVAA